VDVEVDQAVARDLVKHVVEEADAGREVGLAGAVQIHARRDPGFRGCANHLRLSLEGRRACGGVG
jgi:hypothetical protein